MTEGLPDAGDESPRDATRQANPPPGRTEAATSSPRGAAAGAEAAEGKEGVADDLESADDEREEEGGDSEDDDEEEDGADDEPKLKYARLTHHLGAVYRNGDATSSFVVAGDKMIIGTHNGNIHVIQSPVFQPLRVYHAHAASVTSISMSPFPPPLPSLKPEAASRLAAQASGASPIRPGSRASESQPSSAAASRRPKEPPPIPNTPSNNIHIATSSMDGTICVQSLIDLRDVSLRNFARPVQAVALSPDYKNDKTYISGGLAGQLILTVGAPQGRSTATTTGASAQAAGWLNSMVGATTGKDTVLHSGEGTINTIKWSLTGKYVVWLNEHGIKLMRTKLHLDSSDSEDAWKRIGHIDRPQTGEWETMASVWKGRAEWVDEQAVESDENAREGQASAVSPAEERLKQQQVKDDKRIERLLVGWGGSAWIIHVHPGSVGVGRHAGERSAGRAEIVKFLRMDCIISGISLYTQNLLLVLAYCLPEDEEDEEDDTKDVVKTTRGHKHAISSVSTGSEPSGGIPRKINNQPPELRLIDLSSQSEADKDGLSVSRFERLSSNDYHLGILPAQNVAPAVASSRGVLESLTGLGSEMWNATINARTLFNSGASVRSGNSGDGASGSKATSTSGTVGPSRLSRATVHPNLITPGIKIFIHSPYDCILATKRDLGDHLSWLLDRQQYQEAWELVDEHPEIMIASERPLEGPPATPDRTTQSDDFYEETSSVMEGMRHYYSSGEKEKRRIGELWVQELVEDGDWRKAGEICGKVLGSPDRWEKWVWRFAGANKFDEIANYIPAQEMRPPIPGTIYEVVLGHYIENDKPRFRDLLDRWSPDLFDVKAITTALENQLKFRDVREDSVEDGVVGRDWRIVMESLARLHEVNGRNREALKCYIKLQDADSAMRLIKDSHLAEAVADDIPSFIGLRVPQERIRKMTREEIEEATSEAITLLVDEAQHGLVKPQVVVSQLQEKELNLYTYFYLRGLWRGEGIHEHAGEFRGRLLADSQSMVDEFADEAVHLFALFDRPLLMDYLKVSTAYALEKAADECEHLNYVPELVYLYSKTGQVKRALYLIIDRLGDVSQAIAFAKEQDDPDLWDDLLDYSMDKPRFIRGLLEEVGTAINPITLVRRIPEGLAVEGLREGLKHIMKEHEIQYSISLGAARVMRSEVAAAQNRLRSGQQKGVKFEVHIQADDHVDVQATDVQGEETEGEAEGIASLSGDEAEIEEIRPHKSKAPKKWQPGHCAQCFRAFTEWETETLVGFTCGHVFHLTHLLEHLHPGVPVDIETATDEAPHRKVAAKVTHARLLRDRIDGGCPMCSKTGSEELME
ncbi:hypothetical protein GQ53DRAFT_726866 [Thozetella sp. PMI_491]|nr:hypothetical protein GQ53DRAFT_726866 [Thozetella sp. PMI_491]